MLSLNNSHSPSPFLFVPDIPKCIPTILLYPVCLITLPEDSSPWMNHSSLLALVKHAFPHGGRKKKNPQYFGRLRKENISDPATSYTENKTLPHINMQCCRSRWPSFYLTHCKILIYSKMYRRPFDILLRNIAEGAKYTVLFTLSCFLLLFSKP